MRHAAPVLVLFLWGCGSLGGGGDGGPKGQGLCSSALAVTQTTQDHSTPATAQLIDSGGASVVLLPETGTELTGFFKVTGYAPGQSVKAQIVKAPCSTTGCVSTFDFSFSGPTGDDLFTTSGSPCGSRVFQANASGELTPSVAGGGTDGQNLGLWLVPL